MKTIKNDDNYDVWLEPSDWRYSAAIVGLYKFLTYYQDCDYEITKDYLKLKKEDITEERFLKFVEYYYGEELQYKQLEKILQKEECSQDEIKLANDLLKANSILKKVFGKEKFDGTNSSHLLSLLERNRNDLIKETFRNKSNMYANYANTGQLFEGEKSCCRLLGYYIDGGRKSKSISYNFDTSTFVANDDEVFDFIPFAFVGDRETLFINDNYIVSELIRTNEQFERLVQSAISESNRKINHARKLLFKTIQESSDFLNYDIEVITKDRDNSFFETMYIRKDSIKILKQIKVYEPFCFSVKITDNYYMDIQKEVINCILNGARTDGLIEFFLKKDKEKKEEYLISLFIKINQLICRGGETMNQSMKGAYACAKEVANVLPENKLEGYRQKLTSTIVFKDYDRFCQILLQLSNYSEVTFDFAYSLFEDFESNKDIAYTFINALTKKKEN